MAKARALAGPLHFPDLPPRSRSRTALALSAAAAMGQFELQVCAECATTQYPPREACWKCLSSRLEWRTCDGYGQLLSSTRLVHSHSAYFRSRLPWYVGLVQLDCGPSVLAHLSATARVSPTRVRVSARVDQSGGGVLIAAAIDEVMNMTSDRQLIEMTIPVRGRSIFILDAQSPCGQALAREFVSAEAGTIWVGHAVPWSSVAGCDTLTALPGVKPVPLDITNNASVDRAAADIGAGVEIFVNNLATATGAEPAGAQSMMYRNYFGLLQLAQRFETPMSNRRAHSSAVLAWVNVLSVFALGNEGLNAAFAAAMAAARAESIEQRKRMRAAGIRVLNVFPGPLEGGQDGGPKVSAATLSRAVVAALADGIEDVYPGAFAQDWLARWRANPLAFEHELAVNR
jgi:uncharacterized OB-fold protein/NAD(P)-dependent dehydrogenase (short-subunit alcohol dehydrogenase family)